MTKTWTYPELVKLTDDIRVGDEYSYEILTYREFPIRGRGTLRFTLRVRKWRQDTVSGEMGYGYGGEYMLPEKCSASAVLLKAMRALLDYDEHEAREHFEFRGEAILGPHPVLVKDEKREG